MFRSIGVVIVLYFIVSTFQGAVSAFEEAIVATFSTVTTAAQISESQLRSLTK